MRNALLILLLAPGLALADGKVFSPKKYKDRPYKGSLEEQSQEAILIYTPGEEGAPAVEDMILKISVKGEVDRFAWVIPFPSQPEVEKAEAKLFEELFRYVESRKADLARPKSDGRGSKSPQSGGKEREPVEVLTRKAVGSYDVAIVRENESVALNRWLDNEGYHSLGNDAEDVLRFYRERHYVFACLKIKDATPDEKKYLKLHPVRFTFQTGRDEGIYFPMKLTGLQTDPFTINLYVFHRYWIDDHQSEKGYEHRGFKKEYRDWDSANCTANAGKTWSAPESDPFLQPKAPLIPTVTRLFQTLHPGKRYYLTQIRGQFQPKDVRQWSDDLWLESYRVNRLQRAVPWLLGGGVVLALSLVVGLAIWKLRTIRAPEGGEASSQG